MLVPRQAYAALRASVLCEELEGQARTEDDRCDNATYKEDR
jgi:hypothetical protein